MSKDAKIFAKTIEDEAKQQIQKMANHIVSEDSIIRIMPDCHAGIGCTIGTTMTIPYPRVCPNLVGVDIGCGMLAAKILEDNINLEELDKIIHNQVPSGQHIYEHPHYHFDISELRCIDRVNVERAQNSIGTLGGGNHFIEVDKGRTGLWIVIHSGSRHLGLEVARYYQKEAEKRLSKPPDSERIELIEMLKRDGRTSEINRELQKLKEKYAYNKDKELAYCEGELFYDYLHDISIIQKYASANRNSILETIQNTMSFTCTQVFTTMHNYIDLSRMILRKGAVSAEKHEMIIIPMNMRDGSLICLGKGNPDWNYSAPHGAGRVMSRTKAKELISMDQYEQSMQGIYSTSVNENTLDESPFVYKNADEIKRLIEPTCEIIDIIKPIYNFKASDLCEL